MKDLKDIILEKRIKEWEIEGKKIPELYLAVFNSYLEEIAESLADYTKQVRKEVVQEIKEKSYKDSEFYDLPSGGISERNTYLINEHILDQIQGEDNEN